MKEQGPFMNVSSFEGWNAGFRSEAVVDDIIKSKGWLEAFQWSLDFFQEIEKGFKQKS